MPSTFSWLNIRKLVKQQESFSGWFFVKLVVFKTQRQDCGFFSFTKSLIHPKIILVWIQQFLGCLPQYPPGASRLNLAFFSFARLLLLFVLLNSLQFNLHERRARTHVRSLTACTQFDFHKLCCARMYTCTGLPITVLAALPRIYTGLCSGSPVPDRPWPGNRPRHGGWGPLSYEMTILPFSSKLEFYQNLNLNCSSLESFWVEKHEKFRKTQLKEIQYKL